MNERVQPGCGLREALNEARSLGLQIDDVRRAGEIRVHSGLEGVPPCTINARRKDAPRRLTILLARVHAARSRPAPVSAYRCRRCGFTDPVDRLPLIGACPECGCGFLEHTTL